MKKYEILFIENGHLKEKTIVSVQSAEGVYKQLKDLGMNVKRVALLETIKVSIDRCRQDRKHNMFIVDSIPNIMEVRKDHEN